MTPTRSDYSRAMAAITKFKAANPEFDGRAPRQTGTNEHKVSEALNIADFTAGMWACGEKTHYSAKEFEKALETITTATGIK